MKEREFIHLNCYSTFHINHTFVCLLLCVCVCVCVFGHTYVHQCVCVHEAPQLKVGMNRLTVTGEKGYSMIRATHGNHTGVFVGGV